MTPKFVVADSGVTVTDDLAGSVELRLMADRPRTALARAHESFLRSLPERGRELRDLCRKIATVPLDERFSARLRERLQALHASAQVFQEQALLDGIQPVLDGLDASLDQARAGAGDELGAVYALATRLGAGGESLAAGGAPDRSPASELFRRELWSLPPPGVNVGEPNDELGASVAIAQTVTGTLVAPEVISVLALANADVQRELRIALPADACELSTAAEAETALDVIDQVAPDLVLVETTFLEQGGESLAARLRGARAQGVRAVVAVVPEGAGDVRQLLASSRVDGALRLPLLRAGLRERLLQLAGRGMRSGGGIEPIEGGTVDEIARSVGETVRRGIADSLRVGRGERIELPNSYEVLAAAWSAVARIRTHLADHARGRVQFDDALYPEGPAALALTDDLPAAPYVGVSDSLRGRRILLADDDPAVLWFFATLLAEAGAIPIEARSGREALEFARRRTPDLMISDILMPEIDGFSLCREFKRELGLSHVPVILLSWKEDFLQRMRELDAGATGYLRKEAGSHQILSTVAAALRPRAELATLLGAGGEVHGRIDTLGVAGVLQCVAAHRPDAHVAFRDAWNAFEVEIRNGSTLSVTRTASDGSFGRGALALRQLLGVEVGRFVAVDADGTLRNAFEEPLDKVLADGVRDLGAVLDAVSDRRLLQVNRVQFDDQVLAPLLSATPTVVADVAARLRAGESTKELILSGAFAPRDLEQHLRELARRGTIVGVLGPDGEDLVEAARRLRVEQPGTLLHGGERPRRTPSLPPTDLDEEDVQWLTAPETLPPAAPAATALVWVTPPSLETVNESSRDGAPDTEDATTQADAVLETDASPVVFAAGPDLIESAEVERDDANARIASAPVTPLVPPTAAAPAQSGKGLPFLFSVAALAAIGFVAARLLAPNPIGGASGAAHGGRIDTGAQRGPARKGVSSNDPQKLGFGRVLPFIDRGRGVQVADGSGLLVVEHDARTQAPRVYVDRRDVGQAPIAIALPAGQHELSIEDSDRRKRSRLVDIRAGETRILGIVD